MSSEEAPPQPLPELPEYDDLQSSTEIPEDGDDSILTDNDPANLDGKTQR